MKSVNINKNIFVSKNNCIVEKWSIAVGTFMSEETMGVVQETEAREVFKDNEEYIVYFDALVLGHND